MERPLNNSQGKTFFSAQAKEEMQLFLKIHRQQERHPDKHVLPRTTVQ